MENKQRYDNNVSGNNQNVEQTLQRAHGDYNITHSAQPLALSLHCVFVLCSSASLIRCFRSSTSCATVGLISAVIRTMSLSFASLNVCF